MGGDLAKQDSASHDQDGKTKQHQRHRLQPARQHHNVVIRGDAHRSSLGSRRLPSYDTFMFTPRPIGHARTPYNETSKIPKGLGVKHDAEGVLEILPEFEPGLLDIEGLSHLYVLWVFDRSEGFDLVGKPPCDDRPHGVFATRSPRRPNPIALTVVELLSRDANKLRVRGVDMLDGTPILDIKPYLSNVPEEKLRRGWLAEAEARKENQD